MGNEITNTRERVAEQLPISNAILAIHSLDLSVLQTQSTMSQSLWPKGAKAAVSITLDNVGESRAVGVGEWPESKPIGEDPSVLEVTPRILDILDKHGVLVTYFMEAWGMQTYQDLLLAFQTRGHEIAFHAYQHEEWKSLNPDQEKEILNKSLAVARELGVQYKGFRPPGGSLNGGTKDLLRSHGFKYASKLGETVVVDDDGFVGLPFKWRAVDAFYILDLFDFLRVEYGEQPFVFSAEDFQNAMIKQIDAAVNNGEYLDLLFHPFLYASPEYAAAFDVTVAYVRDNEDIWCAPLHEVADWISARSR